MTALKYDESKDFEYRKVNIPVFPGKLRNHVHLSHLDGNHASLARVSINGVLAQWPHSHKWRELHVVESLSPLNPNRVPP